MRTQWRWTWTRRLPTLRRRHLLDREASCWDGRSGKAKMHRLPDSCSFGSRHVKTKHICLHLVMIGDAIRRGCDLTCCVNQRRFEFEFAGGHIHATIEWCPPASVSA